MNEKGNVIRELLRKIPCRIRVCLCTGIIAGILIHAYMLTNKLPNWDDINNVGGYAVGSEFGRWFLKYVSRLDGSWSAPWLSGLFAIVMVSLAACMMMEALELRGLTSAVLIPLMLISFPSMCSLFTFMFTADCYAVGILFACTAAWLIRKYRYGFIPGIVLLVLSLGIYQAYLCMALGILVCGLFLDCLKDEEEAEGKLPRRVFRKGVRTLVILAAAVLIYNVVSRLIYPDLDSYNGLNNMGHLELSRLPRLILRACKWVAEYFILKPRSFVTGFTRFLNILCCALAVGFIIAWFVKKRLYQRPWFALLYLFLAGAVPLAMGSIIIMAPDASVSMLMLHQFCLLYVFVTAMLEKSRGRLWKNVSLEKGFTIAAVAVILLIGYQNFVVTNQAYFRMEIAYERAYAYYNRLLVRMEETQGYRTGDAFALIGEYGLSETPDLLGEYGMDKERFGDLSGVAMETGLLTSGVRWNFVRTYIGVSSPEVDEETVQAIRDSQEYQEMPSYPEQGCVRQIQGVWVLKTCEETLLPQD